MPRRGKKQTEQKKDAQPLPNFAGTLKRMDAKLIVVELDDNRRPGSNFAAPTKRNSWT